MGVLRGDFRGHLFGGTNPSGQRLSRRLVLSGALSFAAAGGARAQTPPAESALPALSSPDSVRAGTNGFQQMTVSVMIGDRGPYRFVVDTGAEVSVIADSVATELGLPASGRAMVDGLAGRLPADVVTLEEISFGPFRRRRLRMPVLPRGFLLCDGYLGLDVLDQCRVTFDFKGGRLSIEEPTRFSVVGGQMNVTKVQLSGRGGRLRVTDCLVDGVRAAAFIDTGAEVSVGNPELLEALNRKLGERQILARTTLSGVTGGQVPGDIVSVARIKMQQLMFSDLTLAIADVPTFRTWGLERQPALLIGMDFLRQFAKVTIDYRYKDVRFELAESVTRPPYVSTVALG